MRGCNIYRPQAQSKCEIVGARLIAATRKVVVNRATENLFSIIPAHLSSLLVERNQ